MSSQAFTRERRQRQPMMSLAAGSSAGLPQAAFLDVEEAFFNSESFEVEYEPTPSIWRRLVMRLTARAQ